MSPEFWEWLKNYSGSEAPVDFYLILANWPLFLQGFINTMLLVVISVTLGAIIALPLGIVRAYQTPFASQLVGAYVYVFRGTPLLVQLYLLYYGVSQIEAVRDSLIWPVIKDAWGCALIAFTLNTAAYQIEIFRGGIEAVPRGEAEAARAFGMSMTTALRRIIVPSAVRRSLPMLANETILMFHGSVVASTITVIDILGAGRAINARYYLAYEGFIGATILYMIIIFGVTRVFRWVESRSLKHLVRPA